MNLYEVYYELPKHFSLTKEFENNCKIHGIFIEDIDIPIRLSYSVQELDEVGARLKADRVIRKFYNGILKLRKVYVVECDDIQR